MRTILSASVASVLLTACAGPIVSERFVPDQPDREYVGTAHGLYCLPKQYFTLTVEDKPKEPADNGDAAEESNASKPSQELEIEISVKTEADLDHLYRLGFDESWTAADDIQINYIREDASRPEGTCLLANITSDVTDKLPEIAKKLAHTVARLSTGNIATTSSGKVAAEKKSRFLKQVFELNPSKQLRDATAARINAGLRAAGFELEIELKFEGVDQVYGTLLMNRDVRPDGKNWGVFGRIAQPYRISLRQASSTTAGSESPKFSRLVDERIVYSHNGLPPFFVAINRSAFVQRKTTINFADGYPSLIQTDKKSELQEFANIPLDIVTQIVGAPAAALETDASRIRKQSELIDEQKKVIDGRKALEAEKKKSGGNKQGGDPGAASPQN